MPIPTKMKSKLVKLKQFSGNKATIYGVWFDELKQTSFDLFISENINVFKSELNDIVARLISIGKTIGAREQFFKQYEGMPGDGVCALFDIPGKKLRLYCIRYGTLIVIVGSGSYKNVQKLQQFKKLKDENEILKTLSAEITRRIKEGDIWYSDDYMELEGNLEFNNEENED